jgi:AcrR family transcriptional regulator
MGPSAFPLPPPDRLPSGRHSLSVEAVRASQRGRLLWAIVQAVAEKGYSATTVADIVERANVSRTTFYQQFQDKEECFLAAFDFGVEFVLAQMRAAWEALGGAADWREHTRSDLSTYLDTLAAEPAFAIALHVEVFGAGVAALDRRAQMLGLFTERTRRIQQHAREVDAGVPERPPELFAMHTGGIDELIRQHLRAYGAASLPELAEPLLLATFALFGKQ